MISFFACVCFPHPCNSAVICLGVNFFLFFLLRICWVSWNQKLMISVLSSNAASSFSLSSLSGSPVRSILGLYIVAHVSYFLKYIFHPLNLSMLHFWVVSCDLPSSSVILSLAAYQFSSVQFSRSVVSDSLWPHGLQHARPPCPSPTPGAYSNSCPSSRWCHPTISSSVIPFSSCLQSFPASGSFTISQFFTSGGQSIGASASASVLFYSPLPPSTFTKRLFLP